MNGKDRAGRRTKETSKEKKKAEKVAAEWAQAKKLCNLNEDDIRMARELGMTPISVIKNRPSKNEQWKAPVKEWILDLYKKRFGQQKQP